MTNMNLYSRGDKLFVILNMVLIGLFTISTLYPFIYIASLSMSTGFEARAGNVILAARHHHPHEQITYVMSGKFEFTVGDDTYIVTAGDSLYKQPNIEHGAKCLEAGTLLDIFTPHREDFL